MLYTFIVVGMYCWVGLRIWVEVIMMCYFFGILFCCEFVYLRWLTWCDFWMFSYVVGFVHLFCLFLGCLLLVRVGFIIC